jgi:hypothetical protein
MPLICAFATSHAYTFQEPEPVAARASKANVERAGRPAADTAEARAEPEDNRLRTPTHRRSASAEGAAADAVLMVATIRPRISAPTTCRSFVYTGGDYVADDWDRKQTAQVAAHPEIASTLVEGCLDEGFDVGFSSSFRDGKLLSHAHVEPILYLVRDSATPVVPVFVNAVHPPAPSAARCYAFGQARRVIDRRLGAAALSPVARAACRTSRLRIRGRTTSAHAMSATSAWNSIAASSPGCAPARATGSPGSRPPS